MGGGGGFSRDELAPLLPHLRAFARTLAGGDAAAADDLVQDTMLLALRAWERFEPGTNLKAWLFRILRNRFLSLRARSHVRAEVAVDDLERRAWVPASQETLAELPDFKRAFARLSPLYREALVLAGVHGLSYERMAEVCGCEVGAVKSRLNRARTALRRMVAGEGETPAREPARLRRGPAPRAAEPPPVAPVAASPRPSLPPPVLVWLADAERRIGQAEVQLTVHRLVVERLERAGVAKGAAEAALGLAARRLAALHAGCERLLAQAS